MKITSINDLIEKIGYDEIDILFCDYIEYYINSGKLKLEITNKYNNDFIPAFIYDNPGNVYKNGFIHCSPNEYFIMNKYLQQNYPNYEYNIDNKDFIKYMINSTSYPTYWDTFPGEKIYNIFIQHNEKLNINKKDYPFINNIFELADINDNIGDKYKLNNSLKTERAKTVLYINGTVLCDDCIHEELLSTYNKNYKKYEKEWIINLNNIEMPITFGDITELDIPCARLILYSHNICELLVIYAGDINVICQEVSKKLNNCKVYTFDSSIRLLIRTAYQNN